MDIKRLQSEISSPGLSDIAQKIAETIREYESKKIDAENARIKLAGYKHLIQIIAIDWMSTNYRSQRARIAPRPKQPLFVHHK